MNKCVSPHNMYEGTIEVTFIDIARGRVLTMFTSSIGMDMDFHGLENGKAVWYGMPVDSSGLTIHMQDFDDQPDFFVWGRVTLNHAVEE